MLMNLAEILAAAHREGFAVPAFNVAASEFLGGVIEACEELESPVIIEIHPDELAFAGDSFLEMVKAEANRTRLPVVIHLDHGGTLDHVMRAVNCGFTSVMIDASRKPLEENIEVSKQVAQLVHPLGISVEAELGTVGVAEGPDDSVTYTDPETARQFALETGIDALAVAIGTAHGIYPKGRVPHLRLDLLADIRKAVPVPLVLHGGSANPDDEIERAASSGVSKVNISSDIKDAFFRQCRKVLLDEAIREPGAVYPTCIKAMQEVVRHKIRLFGAEGKAGLY